MKRAILHFTLFLLLGSATLYSQDTNRSYIQRSFTISDFGDAIDAAGGIVWTPRFSENAVQLESEDGEAGNANTGALNPDPEYNAVRYAEDVPPGISPEFVESPQRFVLGVKGAFTMQGYNWIELRPAIAEGGEVANEDPAVAINTTDTPETAPDPATAGEVTRLPMVGYNTDVALWAWGGNYGWLLEIYLRDSMNSQYRFQLGNLMYSGWRQKRVSIPDSIPQRTVRPPFRDALDFEMIKVWSMPSERVEQFYAYFDLLQTTSIIESDPVRFSTLNNELW